MKNALRLAALLCASTTLFAQVSTPATTDTPTPPQTQPASSPKGFTLEDGTPVKLQNQSHHLLRPTHTVGETVDFEVLEDVLRQQTSSSSPKVGWLSQRSPRPRPSAAWPAAASSTSISTNVRLVDGEKAALRAVKEVKGGGHTGAMTGGNRRHQPGIFPRRAFLPLHAWQGHLHPQRHRNHRLRQRRHEARSRQSSSTVATPRRPRRLHWTKLSPPPPTMERRASRPPGPTKAR